MKEEGKTSKDSLKQVREEAVKEYEKEDWTDGPIPIVWKKNGGLDHGLIGLESTGAGQTLRLSWTPE